MDKKVAWKVVNTGRKSLFAQGKYSLRYDWDKVITAPKGTLGIMCFETEERAKEFADYTRLPWNLIQVEPIGKPLKPAHVSTYVEEYHLDVFYGVSELNEEEDKYLDLAPKGTICYPSVKVVS